MCLEDDEQRDLEQQGFVFNIQKYSVHDGPGIRTIVFLKAARCPVAGAAIPRATKHMWSREYTRANAFLRRNAAFARRYVPRKAPRILQREADGYRQGKVYQLYGVRRGLSGRRYKAVGQGG